MSTPFHELDPPSDNFLLRPGLIGWYFIAVTAFGVCALASVIGYALARM